MSLAIFLLPRKTLLPKTHPLVILQVLLLVPLDLLHTVVLVVDICI
jgi:hypothetical protein